MINRIGQALAATLTLTLVTGCSGDGKKAHPSVAPTPASTTSKAAVTIDDDARQMCEELLQWRMIKAESGESPAPIDNVHLLTAYTKAQTSAITTKVPEIRQIVAGHMGEADTTALQRWCNRNGL